MDRECAARLLRRVQRPELFTQRQDLPEISYNACYVTPACEKPGLSVQPSAAAVRTTWTVPVARTKGSRRSQPVGLDAGVSSNGTRARPTTWGQKMVKRHDPDPAILPNDPGETSSHLRDSVGITLLVVDGPHDGIVFGDSSPTVTFGRGAGNTIELPLDVQVSQNHCVVRFSPEAGCWTLEDCSSTNGTWFEGRKISSPQNLSSEIEFVIGTTVIRCQGPGAVETFLPNASRIEDEVRKLVQRLDASAARGFGAATMLALREHSAALTDRHLLLGLVSANPDMAVVSHGTGLITERFLSDRVNANEYWTGPKQWIAQLVRADGEEPSFFADQLLTTPRVQRVLMVAEHQADNYGHDQIAPENLCYGLFVDANCRLREWFQAERGDSKRLLSELAREKTGVSKRRMSRPPTGRKTTDSFVSSQAVPHRTVLDPAVLDLAASTLQTATKYRLASAEDRHKALKETVTEVIAAISAERRREVLEQLRECFPVTQCAPIDSTDNLRFKQRISELEAALKDADVGPGESSIHIPWSDILSAESEVRLDLLQPEDATAVDLVQHLAGFSLAVERFIIGIVAGLMQSGSMSGRLSVPGFKTTIRRALNLGASGQPAPDELKAYLTALETWLVAAIAAYHSAPEEWFAEFWLKTGPSRIEAKVPAKFLNDAKCWSQYKSVVRRISPDLVGDEIHARVRDNAQKQYDELIRKRS